MASGFESAEQCWDLEASMKLIVHKIITMKVEYSVSDFPLKYYPSREQYYHTASERPSFPLFSI